jgi:hypothetical protein
MVGRSRRAARMTVVVVVVVVAAHGPVGLLVFAVVVVAVGRTIAPNFEIGDLLVVAGTKLDWLGVSLSYTTGFAVAIVESCSRVVGADERTVGYVG